MRRSTTVLIAVVALLGLHRLVVVPWVCNHELQAMRGRTEQMLADAEKNPMAAYPAARAVVDLSLPCSASCPQQIEWPLSLAAGYRVLGEYDLAAATYRSALQTDQRPEIYVQLGLVQLDARRVDEAVVSFGVALRFSDISLEEIPDGYRHAAARKAADTALVLDVLRRRGAQATR